MVGVAAATNQTTKYISGSRGRATDQGVHTEQKFKITSGSFFHNSGKQSKG